MVAFWERIAALQRQVSAANAAIEGTLARLEVLETALERSRTAPGPLDAQLNEMRQALFDIEEALGGNQSRAGRFGAEPETVESRLGFALQGTSNSGYGPAPSHARQLGMAEQEFSAIRDRLNALTGEEIPAFERALAEAGAPWTPDTPLP